MAWVDIINPFIPQRFQAMLSRPGFIQYVKSAYYLGGYEVTPGINISLDEEGLEWVRTLDLTHQKQGYTMRVVDPQDLEVLVGPNPKPELVRAMYGPEVKYEGVCLQYYRRPSGWMPEPDGGGKQRD